eukprot:148726-Rhodomonas_salina.2
MPYPMPPYNMSDEDKRASVVRSTTGIGQGHGIQTRAELVTPPRKFLQLGVKHRPPRGYLDSYLTPDVG